MKFSNKFLEMLRSKGGIASRQTDYTSILIFLLILIILALIIALVYYFRKKYNVAEHKNFNSLAQNLGLSSEEARILYNILIKYNVKSPLTCFTNARLLDDVLRKSIRDIHLERSLTNEEKEEKVEALLNIKIKIETGSRKNIGIRSTHLISENQKLIVFIREKGYFYAIVRKNLRDYLLIEFISNLITKRILNVDEFIKIYFWRNEDAGYIFESKVLEFGDDIKSYKIKHSDKLIRSQKRKYKRIPVNFTGTIYPISREGKNKYKVELEKIETCNIIDLSAGGLKLITENINKDTKFLKIEFQIGDKPITLIGKVIRIDSNPNSNIKEVIIQIAKITLSDKNTINSYIYNYLPTKI